MAYAILRRMEIVTTTMRQQAHERPGQKFTVGEDLATILHLQDEGISQTRAIKERLDREHITIPFPQRDVHVTREAEPEPRLARAM